MPDTPKDPWTSFLDLLSRIITPAWGDLILLIPFTILLLALLVLVNLAFRWQRAGASNRPRVPRPLANGAPPPGVHLPGPSRWPFVVPFGAMFILFGLALRPRGAEDQPPVDLPLVVLGVAITLVAIAGWLRDAMREWRATEREAVPGAGTLVTAGGAATHLLAPAAPLAPEAARASASVGTNRLSAPVAAALAATGRKPGEAPPGVHLPGPSPWPFFAPIALMFIFLGLVYSLALIIGGLMMGVIAAAGWLRDAGSEYRQTDAGRIVEPRTRDPKRAVPRALIGVYLAIAALSLFAVVGPNAISAVITRATPAPSAAPSVGGSGGPPPGSPVAISASGIKFSTDHLEGPAAKPFQLAFDNQEAVPHNVQIFEGPDPGSAPAFTGTIITGPKQTTYEVPALAAGPHYFQCSVHPNMKGTLDAH